MIENPPSEAPTKHSPEINRRRFLVPPQRHPRAQSALL